MGVALEEIPPTKVAYRGSRRGVDVQADVLAELADTEEMSAVGDDDDVVQVEVPRESGQAMDLLLGVGGGRLGDDVADGDSMSEKIVASDTSLGIAGVFVAAAAEGDDDGCDLQTVEIDGVIETEVEGGRGSTGVLGGTEDGDRIGRLRLIFGSDLGDLMYDVEGPSHCDQQKGQNNGA